MQEGADGVPGRTVPGDGAGDTTIQVGATYCICTVPAHCLTDIKWSPDLPRDQRTPLQLHYSRIMKTAILYAQRFWPSFRHSPGSGSRFVLSGAAARPAKLQQPT
jgi:monoamine oxidase